MNIDVALAILGIVKALIVLTTVIVARPRR